MNRCTVYQHDTDIVDFEHVVTMMVEQLRFIGYDYDRKFVINVIDNAMKPESRSVLFVLYHEEQHAIAFSYGNICSGLECGGDYLWVNELFVDSMYRRHHVATELLHYVEQWAKDNTCGYVAMVTHPRNERAQKFYGANEYELEPLIWVDKYL